MNPHLSGAAAILAKNDQLLSATLDWRVSP